LTTGGTVGGTAVLVGGTRVAGRGVRVGVAVGARVEVGPALSTVVVSAWLVSATVGRASVAPTIGADGVSGVGGSVAANGAAVAADSGGAVGVGVTPPLAPLIEL
jgi:hypothetical protein